MGMAQNVLAFIVGSTPERQSRMIAFVRQQRTILDGTR